MGLAAAYRLRQQEVRLLAAPVQPSAVGLEQHAHASGNVVAVEEGLGIAFGRPNGQSDVLDVRPAVVLQDVIVGLAAVAYGQELGRSLD